MKCELNIFSRAPVTEHCDYKAVHIFPNSLYQVDGHMIKGLKCPLTVHTQAAGCDLKCTKKSVCTCRRTLSELNSRCVLLSDFFI